MKLSAAGRLALWLVPLFVLSLVGGFIWAHLTGPSDGTRLPAGEFVWQANGIRITPLVTKPGGLQPGDVVIAIAGQSMEAWARRLLQPAPQPVRWQVGDRQQYTVLRGGQIQEVIVQLEAYPLGIIWRHYWAAFFFALAFPLLAVFVFIKRPHERTTQLFFVACSCFGPPYIPWIMGLQVADLIERHSFWLYRVMTIYLLGVVASIHLAFRLFPEVFPGIRKYPAILPLLYTAPVLLQIAFFGVARWGHGGALKLLGWWYFSDRLLALLGISGMVVVFLKSYYQMTQGAIAHRQLWWIVHTMSLIGGCGILLGMLPEFISGRPLLPYNNLFFLFALQIPLALLLAIVRDQLFDIKIIIRRTLVYGALTSSVILLYIALTGFMNLLLQTDSGEAAFLLTATLVVLFFQPIHGRLQQGVNRLMLGEQKRSNFDQPLPIVGLSPLVTAVTKPIGNSDLQPHPLFTISPYWRRLAPGSLMTVVLLVLLVHGMALPVRYQQLLTVSPTAATAGGQLRPEGMAALAQAGISIEFYGLYFTALEAIVSLCLIAVAFLLVLGRPDDRMALFSAAALLLLALFLPLASSLATRSAQWQSVFLLLRMLTGAVWVPLFYLFPDGSFVPRATRWLTLIWLLYVVACIAVPALRIPYSFGAALAPSQILAVVWVFLWCVSSVWSQAYRYRYWATEQQKQQTKWVIYGLTVAVIMAISGVTLLVIAASRQGDRLDVAARFVGPTVILLGGLQIPISLGIAILRYRLFAIEQIINRTLVYGALTAIVAGIYVVAVGALGSWSQMSGNWLVSFFAAGLVAVLFQPLRERLQRRINRWMYGERDDPYAVLSRLGQRLESTFTPDAILPTLAETVAQTLKLPYAAVALKTSTEFALTAEYRDTDNPTTPLPKELMTLALVYQNEPIGQLLVAPRVPGENFTPTEQQLLADLAHQAAIAVYAVRLNQDLQRSRERLVTAREEERRRLRRDLHDGLGPALSGLILKVDATRDVVQDPAATDRLLVELKHHIQAAIHDIRRLVYNLRPPALDELGLLAALQESAAQLRGSEALHLTLETPSTALPALSAAVEVAAYRIIQEALTNVVRHAQAHHCTVQISLHGQNALQLEVCDDGVGLPTPLRAGVGITAMHERVAELGGVCTVERRAGGGTRVYATLPLPKGGKEP